MNLRVSLSLLFGLLVALGVFLVVQGLVAQSQFRRATSETYQNNSLANFSSGSGSSFGQRRFNGKPRQLTAFSEPPLPPTVGLAAVKPPSISTPNMVIPDVDVPFGISLSSQPEVAATPETEAPAETAGTKTTTEPALRAGNLVVIKRVPAEYPRRAAQRRIEGSVTVKFTVQPDGSVTDPSVVSASPRRGIFDTAALQAVTKWKFKPIRTATDTTVTLTFSLGHN